MEHKDIPDAQLHQMKGAASASAGQVPIATGSGTTIFGFLDWAQIVNKPVASGYQTVLSSFSSVNQTPSAVNTPLQVVFGAAQSTTDVSITAGGLLTFNTSGSYLIDIFLRFGRTGASGTAIILNRMLKNGAQILNSTGASLTAAAQTIPFSAAIPMTMASGDTLRLEVARDGAGANDGGLYVISPTIGGWNIVPSATIVVSKFIGGV
jgi:hypothetical protein